MPEHLTPGVHVEEVGFRSKAIEGVPTSTAGFAGMTAWGPVQYVANGARGPRASEPRLVTSFTDFERVYGRLDLLHLPSETDERQPYLAHATRAFFMNGGRRLFVSRVFVPRTTVGGGTDPGVAGRAIAVASVPATTAVWRARWPGRMGNVLVTTFASRSRDVAVTDPVFGAQADQVGAGSIVEISVGAAQPDLAPLTATTLAVVSVDQAGCQTFARADGSPFPVGAGSVIQVIEARVRVDVDDQRVDTFAELGLDPRQPRYIGRILQEDNPEDEDAVVWLDYGGYDPANLATPGFVEPGANPIDLLVALVANPSPRLMGGNDGDLPTADDLAGREADLADAAVKATGLAALGEVDDIAIVALPDGGTYGDRDLCFAAGSSLVAHAERHRDRFAVVDAPVASSMAEIRAFRGRFDSKDAALYHPWIEIVDPARRAPLGSPPRPVLLPPSGFVTGVYARSDLERGVFKAPANLVVKGVTRLEADVGRSRQDVLNPEGINVLRLFPGKGTLVWGARTMSSDPEWTYVNVRRLLIFLEQSISEGTQWAAFEPNDDRLWANIRQAIESFLIVQWRDGALQGARPEEAFFVRCDRTTMTQGDIDNGRLICLIGVAPTRPAEFVMFRIGQWTAGATVG